MRRGPYSLLVVLALAMIAACASHESLRLTTRPSAAEPPSNAPAVSPSGRAEAVFEPARPLDLDAGLASMRDQYNRSYSKPGFQLEPNAFLIQTLDQIVKKQEIELRDPRIKSDPDPTALEIAMGNGRNAILLAQRGYRTVAFDLSDVGVNMARRRAAQLGLANLDAQVADAYRFDYGVEKWNVVVMMYFYIGDDHIQTVKDAVKPGGSIIMELTDHRVGNEVLSGFMDWEIAHYEHDHLPRDWAPYDNKSPGSVLRLVAKKPKPR